MILVPEPTESLIKMLRVEVRPILIDNIEVGVD